MVAKKPHLPKLNNTTSSPIHKDSAIARTPNGPTLALGPRLSDMVKMRRDDVDHPHPVKWEDIERWSKME
ncbi:MAG: hypothetical protein HUU55_03860 [Myxococcales bacterium]|nr:hypothetical protein [Myxococcales bacterium]